MADTVLLDVRDSIADIVLNRPHRRNAIDGDMRERLADVMRQVDADRSVRAVILRGAQGHFCSGGDIGSIQNDTDAASKRRRLITAQQTVSTLVQLECPVIAVVEGVAFGAGLGLAATADFILAASDARFCASFQRIGLVPDFGLFYTLPRLVGMQRAKELLFSAREVGATEAMQIGLALEVHPAEALVARARAMATAFAGASPTAISLSKRALGRSSESNLSTMLAIEADAQGIAFSTDYAKQALQRFMDKAPPMFAWPAAPPCT